MTLQKDPDRNEIKFLHKFADFDNRRVMEIGCGEGRLTWQYAQPTNSTIAIDPDMDAMRVARVDRASDLADTVYLACADAIQLPFADEKFDLAILAWSL
jgi:ubiquinone/menaquinone biosynthesis C-methylase UbiE